MSANIAGEGIVVLLAKENTSACALASLSRPNSDGLEVSSSEFATALIRLDIERELLALVEILHACAFDCRDVNEHVWAGIIILHDETKTLLGVEKLNGTCGHAMASL
jgi:hypothetical protein